MVVAEKLVETGRNANFADTGSQISGCRLMEAAVDRLRLRTSTRYEIKLRLSDSSMDEVDERRGARSVFTRGPTCQREQMGSKGCTQSRPRVQRGRRTHPKELTLCQCCAATDAGLKFPNPVGKPLEFLVTTRIIGQSQCMQRPVAEHRGPGLDQRDDLLPHGATSPDWLADQQGITLPLGRTSRPFSTRSRFISTSALITSKSLPGGRGRFRWSLAGTNAAAPSP